MSNDDHKAFNGFPLPTSNFFSMPNTWTDITADIDNLAELKVIEYVLRHTWGFHEFGKPKAITTDEFMHGRISKGERMDKGTGLSNKSVVEGLKKAIAHGYLISETDDTDKARVVKAYALKMTAPDSDVKDLHTENSYVTSTHQLCNIYTPDVKNLHSSYVTSTHRSEKETLERHLKKNTKERKKEPAAKSTEDSFSHSSLPQSSIKNSSFSSETKAEEETATLSAEEQQVYELGSQTIFKVKPPKVTPTVKGYCAEIAKAGVTTLDKMESLVAFTKQEKHLIGKTLYLGNLVNALNGWLLSLQPSQSSAQSSAKSRPHTPYILDHKRNEERKAALLAEFEALEAQ